MSDSLIIPLARTGGATVPTFGTFKQIDGFQYVPQLVDAQGRTLISAGQLSTYAHVVLTGGADSVCGIAAQSGIQGISVKAHPDNVGVVYIGSTNAVAASTGYPLSPGDSIDLAIDDDAAIYAIGTAADVVCWIVVGKTP